MVINHLLAGMILQVEISTHSGKMATRNPVNSPVEVGSFIPLFTRGFSTIPGGAGFLNHQQYVYMMAGQPTALPRK